MFCLFTHRIQADYYRTEATYQPYTKEQQEADQQPDANANANDLFFTVPFGFITHDTVFAFAIYNREVITIPYPEPTLRDGVANGICCVVPYHRFFRCAPARLGERSGLVNGKSENRMNQDDYAAGARAARRKGGNGECRRHNRCGHKN